MESKGEPKVHGLLGEDAIVRELRITNTMPFGASNVHLGSTSKLTMSPLGRSGYIPKPPNFF